MNDIENDDENNANLFELMEYTIQELKPCTTYSFFLSQLGESSENLTALTLGRTECSETSTSTSIITTASTNITTSVIDMKPIDNVELNPIEGT